MIKNSALGFRTAGILSISITEKPISRHVRCSTYPASESPQSLYRAQLEGGMAEASLLGKLSEKGVFPIADHGPSHTSLKICLSMNRLEKDSTTSIISPLVKMNSMTICSREPYSLEISLEWWCQDAQETLDIIVDGHRYLVNSGDEC